MSHHTNYGGAPLTTLLPYLASYDLLPPPKGCYSTCVSLLINIYQTPHNTYPLTHHMSVYFVHIYPLCFAHKITKLPVCFTLMVSLFGLNYKISHALCLLSLLLSCAEIILLRLKP